MNEQAKYLPADERRSATVVRGFNLPDVAE